jgi:ribosomal protein L7/L12
MKLVLVLFAVAAAAGAGYVVGDEGRVTAAGWVAVGGALFALLLYAVIPASSGAARVSLRPSSAASASSRPPSARVLRPGDAARLRERERVLSGGGPVALRLIDTGRNQIAVIKVIRNYLDVGLKEAKDVSDAAKRGQSPLVIAEMVAERAREFAADLEKAGAVAELEEPPTR